MAEKSKIRWYYGYKINYVVIIEKNMYVCGDDGYKYN